MTTYLGKSCSFDLPRVPFVNCGQFMYLVISLLVLRTGCGIWLYQFLVIAYLFILHGMVYGMAWQELHCLWCGLASMAWYLVWPRRAWRGIRYYLGRHGMIYGMAWRAWHVICYGLTSIWYSWRTWHGIWYGLAGIWYGVAGNGMIHGMTWRAMPWFMIWPGSQGMVHNMAWRAWHCTWYAWRARYGICYDLTGMACSGMWYGLAGITWYILWPGGHGVVYGMAW